MNKRTRWLVAIGVSVVLLIPLIMLLIHQIGTGIKAATDHKSAKTTTATVASVTKVPRINQEGKKGDGELYRVCFTLDNFDEVEADMRQGYRAVELQRLSKDGPRCQVTAKLALAKSLKKGDKLSVVYLLENEYQIDLAGIEANGQEL